MLIDYLVTFGKWTWLILAAVFFVIELVGKTLSLARIFGHKRILPLSGVSL